MSRLRLRSLGPGAYPVYVFGVSVSEVVVDVSYEPASTKAANETPTRAEPPVRQPWRDPRLLLVQCARLGDLVGQRPR